MNNKGLTLIEIIVSIALIGIIAIFSLPALTFGYIQLLDSKKFTIDTFNTQQQIEQQMEIARTEEVEPGDPSVTLDIFGKTITGHLVQMDIDSPTGTSHGEISVFVPKYKVVYDVPEIDSVYLDLYRDGTLVEPIPDSLFPLDSTVSLVGTKVDGPQEEFLLNVYRWYMSPVTSTAPTNIKDYIILKEWNEARAPVAYEDSEDFTIIPNIEEGYDILDFSEFGFTNEEISDRFAGRFYVYSVTPYSTIGRVGVERFSNIISTNKIVHVDDIYLTVPLGTTYNITDDYSTVPAEMLNGDVLDVSVIWSPAVIDISTPGEKPLSYGTIIGYPDGIEFHLTAQIIAVTGVNIQEETLTVLQGDSYTLTALVTPASATNKDINWSSSDPSVVSVDDDGKITAHGVTTLPVIITATTVDGGFTDTCPVNVDERIATTVHVTGDTNMTVPCSGSRTHTYSATVEDQAGNVMPGESVTWSLVGEGAGITIDSVTGVVTIDSSAVTGTFRVRATSDTNSSAYGELEVSATAPGQASVTDSYATVTNLTGPVRAQFTATVKDRDGNIITGLTMDDFKVSHIVSWNASHYTLTDIDSYSDYSVADFTDNGDGTYTWTIRRESGWNTIRDNVGVQARNPAVSESYVNIQENLDNVRIR